MSRRGNKPRDNSAAAKRLADYIGETGNMPVGGPHMIAPGSGSPETEGSGTSSNASPAGQETNIDELSSSLEGTSLTNRENSREHVKMHVSIQILKQVLRILTAGAKYGKWNYKFHFV